MIRNGAREIEMRMSKSDEHLHLFETKSGKGLIPFRLFAASIFAGIFFIFVYRVTHMPAAVVVRNSNELEAADHVGVVRWTAWIGLFLAELWFGFYWLLSIVVKWKPIYRTTHKHRLSLKLQYPSLSSYYSMFLVIQTTHISLPHINWQL